MGRWAGALYPSGAGRCPTSADVNPAAGGHGFTSVPMRGAHEGCPCGVPMRGSGLTILPFSLPSIGIIANVYELAACMSSAESDGHFMRLIRMTPASGGRTESGAMPNPCAACDVRVRAVCSALSNDELHELSSVSRSRKLDTGEAAFMEGDSVAGYLVVQSGSLKLYKLLPDGRRQIVGFAFAGDLVGLPFERAEPFTAEALQATEVCQLGRDMLEELASASPQMARRLLAVSSHEIAAAQEQMMLLGRKTAEERLASFILWAPLEFAPVELSILRYGQTRRSSLLLR